MWEFCWGGFQIFACEGLSDPYWISAPARSLQTALKLASSTAGTYLENLSTGHRDILMETE